MLARLRAAALITLIAVSFLASLTALVFGPSLASAQTPASTVPMEAPAFTDYVAALLRKQIGADSVAVRSPLTLGVGGQSVSLDEAYLACRRQPSGCADDLNQFVAGTAADFRERATPPQRETLRIMVRTLDYVRAAQRDVAGDSATFRPRPLAGELVTVPVFDTPRATRLINERDYKSLNLSADQTRDLAMRNTYSQLGPLMQVAKPTTGDTVGRLTGDTLLPSRLAIIDDWKPLADAQGGVLIVAAPSSDTVLYIAQDTPAARDALRAAARQAKNGAVVPISEQLFRWTPRGWDPL